MKTPHRPSSASVQTLRFLVCAFAILPLLTAFAADDLPRLAQELGAQWDAGKGTVAKKSKSPPLTADAVQRLLSFPEVKALMLDGPAVDLETAKVIGQSAHLQSLVISHVDVGGLDYLREFAKVKSLTELMVGSSSFGDEGLEALAVLSNLKRLRLAHVSRDPKRPITAKGLNAIADGMPQLEYLGINLHRMEEAMIPALAKMKNLQTLVAEWVSPGFVAKVRAVLPKAKVEARAGRYVRDGFDAAQFDSAKDLIREDGTPFDQPAVKPSPAAEPKAKATPPAAAPPAAKSADTPLPPIEAGAMLAKMFGHAETMLTLTASARAALPDKLHREVKSPVKVLVLSTAPIGPMPQARAKNLHTLGTTGMLVLLREMAKKFRVLTLTEVTDEKTITPEMLAAHEVVLLNNVGQTDRPEVFNDWLPAYVRNGGGMVANHGSAYLFVFQPDAEYNQLLGARLNLPAWGAHPEKGTAPYRVRLPEPQHPLVAAFGRQENSGASTQLADELYNLVADPRLTPRPQVLVEIDPVGMVQTFPPDADDFSRAVVWTHHYGKGRVWYMQFGHFPRALHTPVVADLLLDGLLYAAGRLPADKSEAPPPVNPVSSTTPVIFPYWHKRADADEAWLAAQGYTDRPFMKPPINLTEAEPFAKGKIEAGIRKMKGRGVVMMHFKEHATEADEDRALPELRRLAKLAEELNVQMVVYPYFGGHIDTAERALPFVKKINRSSVGLTLHMPQEIKNGNGGRLPEIIAKVKDHIRLVVVCGADKPKPEDKIAEWEWARLMRPLGDGDYDVRAFVQAVQASGYRGPYGFICWEFKEPTQTYLIRSMTAWNSYFNQ